MSNYYLALGVDRNADLHKIKKAYRICCKRYHPDFNQNVSPEDRQRFLLIQEAYDTLTDEEKRQDYDRELGRSSGSIPVRITKDRITELNTRKSANARHFQRFSSLLDDFFDGYIPGFFEEDTFYRKDLYLELILSPEEARRGGEFPVDVPVLRSCPECGGKGYEGPYICLSCRGLGNVRDSQRVNLHVPPGVKHGTNARVSLEHLEIPGVYLNIDVLIER